MPKSYIHRKTRARTTEYRTTSETVGPECNATKTVDKEQGFEKEDDDTRTGRRERGEREQESLLITISLPSPQATAKREEDMKTHSNIAFGQ